MSNLGPVVPSSLLGKLGDDDGAVLERLLVEVEEGRGWSRRGRRGWRFTEEIQAFGLNAGRLAWLADQGLLDRLDVRERDEDAPHWLYRLTNLGAAVVAMRREEEFHRLSRPAREGFRRDNGSFFAPAEPMAALHALARGARRGEGKRWGDVGWLTLEELRAISGLTFGPASLAWLTERGYTERRDGQSRNDPPACYRATERGQRVRVVDDTATLRGSAAFVLAREDADEGVRGRAEREPAGERRPRPGGGIGTLHLDLARGYHFDALSFLREEALGARGWERRGRAGWRFAYELQGAGIPRFGLAELHSAGMLDRIDERGPYMPGPPMYLYRITDAGARWVAERREEPHRRIEPPALTDADDRGTYFVPSRPIAALQVLVGAAENGGADGGWLTCAQVGPVFEAKDLDWLARHGFATKRTGRTPRGRAARYAATERGRSVRIVADKGIQYGRRNCVLVSLPADGAGASLPHGLKLRTSA